MVEVSLGEEGELSSQLSFLSSYTVWSHLARSRLHMTDELAWLYVAPLPLSSQVLHHWCRVCRYFETFDVVSELEVEERVKMMDMMAKCTSQEERGETRRRRERKREKEREVPLHSC